MRSVTPEDQSSASHDSSLSPFAPQWLDDPYPLYERLRAIGDVVWIDDAFWAITTAAAAREVLRDAKRFASANPGFRRRGLVGPAYTAFQEMVGQLDGSGHRQIRSLLAHPFMPARLDAIQPLVESTVTDLLDPLTEGDECDFAREIAFEFPLKIMTKLLGASMAEKDMIGQSAAGFVGGLGRRLTPDRIAIANRSAEWLEAFAHRLIEQRSVTPGEDLLSVLLAAEEDGAFLNRRQLVVQTMALLLGAYDTTSNSLNNGLQAFFANPDQWELLVRDPALVPQAVEEILRYDPPPQNLARTVKQDMEFYGVELREGQTVSVLTASANRDGALFDEPNRFLITRSGTNHVTFGLGPHYCIGAALSRSELRIALEQIVKRFPHIRPAGDAVPVRTGFFRGYTSLPVVL